MSTTLATLTIRYSLSTGCREHLGAGALSIWDRAFAAELEKSFPGVEVEVDSKWSDVDASSYELTGETVDGESFAGSKSLLGSLEVYDADADAGIASGVLTSLARSISDADAAAWDRACDLANETAG
jgi:hypothetical protein